MGVRPNCAGYYAAALLANIFDVSADELLEIGGKKKEEIVKVFLQQYDELSNKGDHMSKFNLTKEMYEKYPNDYRVIGKYISELFNNPAMDILSILYTNDGLTDKAKEMCEQFPESVYDTVSEQYEQLYCRCDNDKYIEFIKKNLRYTAQHLTNKIGNFGMFATQNADEKIRAFQKCLDLIDLIYDDGDYGFACYHVGHINCLLAKVYYNLKKIDTAAFYLEKNLYKKTGLQVNYHKPNNRLRYSYTAVHIPNKFVLMLNCDHLISIL